MTPVGNAQRDELRKRMRIHPTAVVESSAQIGENVEIGPYTVVGEHTVIGAGTRLRAHVVIEPYVTLGASCDVFSGAVLGGIPQDRKFKGEISYLILGNNNIIREHVTIHRATGAGNATRIGNDNLIMAYCHIGHNCALGNGTMMSNNVGLAGHSDVEDKVIFGGFVGVHQFVRIGKMAMIGGYSKLVQDVPPFMMADGRPCKVLDLNVIGLRRAGVSAKVRTDLKQAYKLLYRSELNMSQALELVETEVETSPERDYLLDFLRHIPFGRNGRGNDMPPS